MSNVTFDGRNYIAYEAWVRKKYGKLTRLQSAQQNVLKEADKQCNVCISMGMDKMLCGGTRRYFDQAVSEELGVPTIVMQGCHKLDHVNELRAIESRFDQSLLFKPVINVLKNQRDLVDSRVALPVQERGMSYRIGKFDLPVCSWVEDDLAQHNREILVDYLGAMIYSGRKATYLRSNDYYAACFGQLAKDVSASPVYRKLKYPEDIYPVLTDADWLVLVNLHGACPVARFRGILFDIVQARFDAAKPTTLVLNPPFNAENETEKCLMELVQSWQKLNLK